MHWEVTLSSSRPLDSLPAGLLFGMQVYTTFRLPLALHWQIAHWERLSRNAEALRLDWPFSRQHVFSESERRYHLDTPICRLTAMADVRGYGDFDANPSVPLPARLFLSMRSAPLGVERPLCLKAVPYVRPMPMLKLGSIPESILLKRAARLEGCDDVLFVGGGGVLREASTSNVFVIRRNRGDGRPEALTFWLETPHPERDGCLPGISRLQISDAAAAIGFPVSDGSPIFLDALRDAEGVFLSNAAQGLRPVRSIRTTGRGDIIFPWTPTAQSWFERLRTTLSLRAAP